MATVQIYPIKSRHHTAINGIVRLVRLITCMVCPSFLLLLLLPLTKILVRHRVVCIIFEYVSIFFDLKILTYHDFNLCNGTQRATHAVGIEYVDDTIGRAKGTTESLVARASHHVVCVVPFKLRSVESLDQTITSKALQQ